MRNCPVCARFTITLDFTHSRYRVRCDKQKGGCGWRVNAWRREPGEALALFKLICWQISQDKERRILTLKKAA